MASHFDELLRELRRAEDVERDADMQKAFAASPVGTILRGFGAADRAVQAVDKVMKSLPASWRQPRKAAPPAADAREMMVKSLEALNLKIGQAAASGSLSAVEIATLEARLHGLVQRAASHLKAGGR